MGQMTKLSLSLALETANYRGTGGVSETNRCLRFQPAFVDCEQGRCIYGVFLTVGRHRAWMGFL
jgi:hypothetical protein